jgi:hypothetical protein
VEQFEICSNDAGFRWFLTVKSAVATECFYGRTDGGLRWFLTVDGETVMSRWAMLLGGGLWQAKESECGDLSTAQNDEAILLRSR